MTTKFDNQSWYSISEYLKDKFGSKVVKLALDGNFTCPNRDGKKVSAAVLSAPNQARANFQATICKNRYLF